VPKLNEDKFVKLVNYCIGRRIPEDYPIRVSIENEARKKNYQMLGAYFLRGLDMDGVIAFILPKKSSDDGLIHYLFIWFSQENVSLTEEGAHATLQIKSLEPNEFSLRGIPETFVKVIGESTMIESILVDLIDDLKCLEVFTIFNKNGSQKDAIIEIDPKVIGTRMIVQTAVSEEPTSPTYGKLERMEMALPQLIDLANYSIMTGLKMYGPMEEFSNFCYQCGKKLPPGDNPFCMHCGAKQDNK